jgi:NTP pyrophosphatase (non-canonical NTP hydrolase)
MGEPQRLSELTARVRSFSTDRDWEQFHLPRSLVLALVGEVGELAEIFQWLTDEQSTQIMNESAGRRVQDELADVFYYVLRLADVLRVDLGDALTNKLKVNAEKYPADKARGSAAKYTEL